MAGPTGKMLTNKQNVMKRLITAIVEFAIGQAVARGVLNESMNLSWKLQVPDISVQDTGLVATALQSLATSLGIAEDRGWIRGETSARAFQSVLTQVGVEVDQNEYDLAQQEKADKAAQDQNALDPQKNLADALKAAQPATQMTQ